MLQPVAGVDEAVDDSSEVVERAWIDDSSHPFLLFALCVIVLAFAIDSAPSNGTVLRVVLPLA